MKGLNLLLLLSLLTQGINSFVVKPSPFAAGFQQLQPSSRQQHSSRFPGHSALLRQRKSVAAIQTQGLFGLGAPEIAIIAIAAAFIVGPQNIGKIAGEFKSSLDDVPDELKKIPDEFQKGIEEGESNARARNAKKMQPPPADD